MGRLSKAVLLAGWVLWTGGCAEPAATSSPAKPASPAPPSQNGSDKRFIIAPELESTLHVVSVLLNHPPGDYLKIQVTVQNLTAAPQQFSYLIDWFDQEGAKVPLTGPEFMPWMLLPHEVSSIAVTAPTPTAADFGIAFVPAAK
jgi:hypothetical protein